MTARHLPQDFPALDTDRLSLVELTREHEAGVLRNFSDPEMMRYIMPPLSKEAEAARFIGQFRQEFDDGAGLTWALIDGAIGEFVGTISYSVDAAGVGDLGFDLWRDRWGEGLMTEALERVLEWGFEVLGSPAIKAHTLTANQRAIRLLERLGFGVVEVRSGSAAVGGEHHDEIFFAKPRPAPVAIDGTNAPSSASRGTADGPEATGPS